MPVCRKCNRLAATCELRRSPKPDGGWMCKDRIDCSKRLRGSQAIRRAFDQADATTTSDSRVQTPGTAR